MPNLLVTATTRYDPKGLNKAKKHISGFEKSVKSLGKTFASVFAAQKLLQFGNASVKAFVADDKAARMLTNSLKNVGAAYAATNVEDYIASLQKTTGVLDDFLRPAFQTLILATGDVTKSQEALALALDISQATGKDLASVSTALAKGFQGNTTALAKMGGAVSKATLATGDMNKITAELTQKYKGSALTAMSGYSGQMAKLGVASANVKEIIGKGLLDALSQLGSSNSVQDTADAMETLAQNTADVIRGIGILAGKLESIPLFSAIVRTIGDVASAGPLGALMRSGQSKVKTGYGQQSPGDRAIAVANAAKLAKAKAAELAILAAKNKATKEEAQMKIDQAALDKLKAKFDLERIGLNAALNNATDEETKARIRAQIAILDETGKSAQAANDALVKAQADKLKNEIAAADSLGKLATNSGLAQVALGKLAGVTTIGNYGSSGFPGSDADLAAKAKAAADAAAAAAGGKTTVIPGTTSVIPGGDSSSISIAAVIAATDAAAAFIESDSIAAIPAIINSLDTTAADFIEATNATQAAADAIDASATSVAALIAATDAANGFGTLSDDAAATLADSLAALVSADAYAALADSISSASYADALAGLFGTDKASKDNAVTITINDNTSGLIAVVADAVLTNNRYGNSLVPTGTITG